MDLVGRNGRKFSKDGKSLYKELELPKGASEVEIKRSYRQLALRFHPDKNPDAGEATLEKFKQINRAHKILMDPEKRKIYDTRGSFGLYLAETVGEENVGLFAVLSTWWCQGLFACGALLTGCCCCWCCYCCCGKCCVPEEDEIPDFEETEEGPTTEQPRTSNSNNGIFIIPVPPQTTEL